MTVKEIVDAPKGAYFAFDAAGENFGIMRKDRVSLSSKRGESYFLYYTGVSLSQTYRKPKHINLRYDVDPKLPIPFDESSEKFYSIEPEDFRKSKIGMLTSVFTADDVNVSWNLP